MASSRFMEGMADIPGASPEKAEAMLDELATGWSRFSVDLIPNLGRAIFSRGSIPGSTTTRLKSRRCAAPWKTTRRCFVVAPFLPRRGGGSGRSAGEQAAPACTFAGINLSFGFMGPLMRRSGVIFLRRRLDDPLYKYVLRQFVGYIVQKRFNLSWSIEGTRSRTGKMLPPKLGLLSYVADAYLDGRSEDILLQPTSISFDQLHETD